jgi:hypothetical protein
MSPEAAMNAVNLRLEESVIELVSPKAQMCAVDLLLNCVPGVDDEYIEGVLDLLVKFSE